MAARITVYLCVGGAGSMEWGAFPVSVLVPVREQFVTTPGEGRRGFCAFLSP
jgi:hypothetical protein